MKELLIKAYTLLITLGSGLQPVILLLFRIYWGWLLYLTGKGKLVNHENVVVFFRDLEIPLPEINAWFVGGLECFGGLLLLIGLCSRPVALLIGINMLVAYISVPGDREKLLGILNDPEPFIAADPFFFLLTALLVFAFGPGRFSLDGVIKGYREGK